MQYVKYNTGDNVSRNRLYDDRPSQLYKIIHHLTRRHPVGISSNRRCNHYHEFSTGCGLYDDRPFGTSSYQRPLPRTPALRRPPITTIIIQQSSSCRHLSVPPPIDDDDPYYICKFFYSSLRYPLLYNYRNANYYHDHMSMRGGDCAAVYLYP
jgi:hypothetical protein